MKNINIYKKLWLLLIVFSVTTACNEEEFLEEVPQDFFSPENAYVTFSDYQSALTDLYARVRSIHYGDEGNQVTNFVYFLGTDIIREARGNSTSRFSDYNVFMEPTNGNVIEWHWQQWYKIISNANTIIDRVAETDLEQSEKDLITAEAKFFRGLSYRYLVYLYGGVPLVTSEITGIKNDFVRATKEEVLNQIAADLEEAAAVLPAIDQVSAPGKVSTLIAQHFLAETYISLGRFDDAITAASVVIDDPNTDLMTTRFGSRATENPGDPYWDLFRRGNQNLEANTEALWVIQMEIDVPGGYLGSSGGDYNKLERWAGPVLWIKGLDPDGNEGMLNVARSNYNCGGRGVSFMRNTDYWINDLWMSDFDNDIRNASHNIVRDMLYNNPASAWFGMSAIENPGSTYANDPWRWYPYPTKITTPGNHPDELYEDKELLTLQSSAGSTYRDMYLLRLAETYLLRAEAYLGNNDLTNAAEDINEVRERANATPIDPADVDIDYILDERARELVYEEPRRITLQRLGKLVERVRLYNELNNDDIKDHHELWPIPFDDIEANTGATLEQNLGY